MKVIGLTGGIGSGKSTVLNYLLDNCNCVLILSDFVGANLRRKGEINYKKIVELFGSSILDENEEISTSKLREITFNDPEKLRQLEEISWGNIYDYIKEEIQVFIELDCFDYIILESALMFESGLDKLCDEIWFISVEKEERIKRIMANRNYTRKMCETVIKKQMKEDEFKERCQKIIDNSGDIKKLYKQIDEILKES